MYEFNYKHTMPGGATITCIVPAAWLALPLPTLGGQVNYIDNQTALSNLPDFLFEFCEETGAQSREAVLLTIYQYPPNEDSGYISLTDHATRITFAPELSFSDTSPGQCEVYLLNHLFGSLALSASLGNICLDVGEVVRWVAESHELRYSFGTGDSPDEILPQLQGQFPDDGADRTFAMLFCREEVMRLEYLARLAKRFTRGGPSFLADAAVTAERMLISTMASDRRTD